MVRNARRGEPTMEHHKKEDAEHEAHRLAAQRPGVIFSVLEVVSAFMAPVKPVKAMELHDIEDVPF